MTIKQLELIRSTRGFIGSHNWERRGGPNFKVDWIQICKLCHLSLSLLSSLSTSFLLSPSSLGFNFFKPQGGLSLTQLVSRVYPLGHSLRSEIMLWLARLESHDYPWKEGSGPGLTGEKQVYRRLSRGEGVWMLLKERKKGMLDGCSAHFLVRRSITLKEDWTTKRYLDRTR